MIFKFNLIQLYLVLYKRPLTSTTPLLESNVCMLFLITFANQLGVKRSESMVRLRVVIMGECKWSRESQEHV